MVVYLGLVLHEGECRSKFVETNIVHAWKMSIPTLYAACLKHRGLIHLSLNFLKYRSCMTIREPLPQKSASLVARPSIYLKRVIVCHFTRLATIISRLKEDHLLCLSNLVLKPSFYFIKRSNLLYVSRQLTNPLSASIRPLPLAPRQHCEPHPTSANSTD